MLQRPKFWLGVAWLLLPVNIVSVLWYVSLPAILAPCVNIAIVAAPLWQQPRQ
jgi:hypothetical protein